MGDVTMYELACLLGGEAAKLAGERFNGRRCNFSNDPGALEFPDKESRRKAVEDLLREGLTFKDIAAMYDRDVRTIQRIVKENLRPR